MTDTPSPPAAKPPEFKYFVAYVYRLRERTGHSNSPVTWPKPITAWRDIQGIEALIREETKFDSITMTGWQRFESPSVTLAAWQRYASYLACCARSGEHNVQTFDEFMAYMVQQAQTGK